MANHRSNRGCGTLLLKWLVLALSVYLAASVVPGIHVTSFGRAMVVAAVLGLLNTFIRPILILLTLPITLLTLGIFLIVINAALLMLAGELVKNFVVEDFVSALLGAVVISVAHLLLDALVSGVAGGKSRT